jgi:hypothetical protein
MMRTRGQLQDEFTAWVRALQDIPTPQWAQPDAARWLEQAADAELEQLADQAADEGRSRPQGGLLVLVSGTSPQPCLLSALWRRPARVIVACSEEPIGQDYAAQLASALREGSAQRSLGINVLRAEPFPSTDPVRAFARLRARLEQYYREFPEDVRHTVLELTGGKKPMISAAFFLAAWRDIPSVYLDSRYHPHARLPEPCTASPVELGNPGMALGLYALREAQRLWEARAYQASEDLLGVASGQIGAGDPDLTRQIEEARALARGVMAWEELSYDQAVADAPSGLPKAVEHLAARWASFRGIVKEPRDWNTELRKDPWHLMLHMADVIHWARRRMGRDHRSLFLRLFSLGEIAVSLALSKAWDDKTMSSESVVEGDFSEDIWSQLNDKRGPLLLAQGSGKDRQNRRWEVPPLTAARPWTDPKRRDLRDVAAHGLAIVRRNDVEALLGQTETLVLAVAERVGLKDAVDTWLEPEHPWFAPPPFPLGRAT